MLSVSKRSLWVTFVIHISVPNIHAPLRGFCINIRTEKYNLITFLLPHAPQVPKDVYPVGSKVEYTCTVGLYLIGESTLECTANQTWSSGPGLCTGEYLLTKFNIYDHSELQCYIFLKSDFSPSLKVPP